MDNFDGKTVMGTAFGQWEQPFDGKNGQPSLLLMGHHLFWCRGQPSDEPSLPGTAFDGPEQPFDGPSFFLVV